MPFDTLMSHLLGSPDLGRSDPYAHRPRAGWTDCLAAPPGVPGLPPVRAELRTPLYPVSPDAVVRAALACIPSESQVTRVDDGTDPLYARFIQRTPLLRFPDTIEIWGVAVTPGHASALIRSRSRFGDYDFGTNRRRVCRWLRLITGEIWRE